VHIMRSEQIYSNTLSFCHLIWRNVSLHIRDWRCVLRFSKDWEQDNYVFFCWNEIHIFLVSKILCTSQVDWTVVVCTYFKSSLFFSRWYETANDNSHVRRKLLKTR
jgi:hypothetical protein